MKGLGVELDQVKKKKKNKKKTKDPAGGKDTCIRHFQNR